MDTDKQHHLPQKALPTGHVLTLKNANGLIWKLPIGNTCTCTMLSSMILFVGAYLTLLRPTVAFWQQYPSHQLVFGICKIIRLLYIILKHDYNVR